MRLSLNLSGERARSAAQWFARSRSGAMTDAEYGELEDWLADAENDREFALAQRLWTAAPGFVATTARPTVAPRSRWFTMFATRWVAAGAGLTAAAAACLAWIAIVGLPSDAIFTAERGQIREVRLTDHSVVDLNADTRLHTSFNKISRNLSLQDGEAFFVVAHDVRRPFVVSAGAVRVTAVGTQFNVRARQPDHVRVDVLEGRVRIEAGGWRGFAIAGQQVAFDGDRVSVGSADAVRIEGWREGQIVLDATPLAQVVEELNLYSDAPIVLGDPAIGRRTVSGRFESHHVRQTLDALAVAVNVHPAPTADGSVLLVDGPAPD